MTNHKPFKELTDKMSPERLVQAEERAQTIPLDWSKVPSAAECAANSPKFPPFPETVEEYRERLAEADPNDDELFRTLVNRGFELFQLDEHDASEEFGISLSSIQRWRAGKNFPHPFVRPAIYAWLAKQE